MRHNKAGVIEDWDLMAQQVKYYMDHLDVFIEDQFAPIKLTKTQRIIARMFGRGFDIKTVCSRGYGKTLVIAICSFAWCALNPGTKVVVCSATAPQATLIFGKLKTMLNDNQNMRRELVSNGKNFISMSKDSASCTFKNGSQMESCALSSARGKRAKVVVIDEALQLDPQDLQAVIQPLKNYKRQICVNYDVKDYPSKSIYITSACEQANPFYQDFVRVLRDTAKGKPGSFASALDYNAAIFDGITDADYFMQQKERMPALVFDIQYGSMFPGGAKNSALPFALTEGCRTLKKIQLEQPKNSKSRYVMAIDIATSQAKTADNSIISVIKFTQRNDGSFSRKLVNMRSFHGKKLQDLSQEVRHIYHERFPSIEKIIYDARGLGDSFPSFFSDPWTDDTGKEYPPLIQDDDIKYDKIAMPVLHPVRAVQSLNQRIYTNLRVALQKKRIELPMNSRIMQNSKGEDQKPLTMYELAVFVQADALQHQMASIVAKIGASGNVLYDTPSMRQHKDRYSSLAYGNDYIAQLEKINMKKYRKGKVCIGITSNY